MLLIFCVNAGSARAEDRLILVTEYGPPVNMPDPAGGVTGLSADLLRAILDDAHIPYSMALYPWARAYGMALSNQNTCVFSATDTVERHDLFKWVGPLAHNEWMLFGRRDSQKLTNLEDAKGHQIGGYIRDVVTDYLKERGLTVDEASDDSLNLKKLMGHRIEYWADGALTARFFAHLSGVTDLVPILKIKDVTISLACNKSVSDGRIDLMNSLLRKLYDDGRAAAIIARYQ